MISLTDLQPLKKQLFVINNGGFYTERYFSDKINASLIEDYMRDGASFRRLASLSTTKQFASALKLRAKYCHIDL